MWSYITNGGPEYYVPYIDPRVWNATTYTSTFKYTTTSNMDISKYINWNIPIEYADPTAMDIDKDGEVAMDKFLDDLCGPST